MNIAKSVSGTNSIVRRLNTIQQKTVQHAASKGVTARGSMNVQGDLPGEGGSNTFQAMAMGLGGYGYSTPNAGVSWGCRD